MAFEPGTVRPLNELETQEAFSAAPKTNSFGASWVNAGGNLHRDGDLPARVCSDGSLEWWNNGKLHRVGDLPSVVNADGSMFWFQCGVCHRANDMPAKIMANWSRMWYKNDKLHRDSNKPAIVHANGSMEWWVRGKQVDEPTKIADNNNGKDATQDFEVTIKFPPPPSPDMEMTCTTKPIDGSPNEIVVTAKWTPTAQSASAIELLHKAILEQFPNAKYTEHGIFAYADLTRSATHFRENISIGIPAKAFQIRHDTKSNGFWVYYN